MYAQAYFDSALKPGFLSLSSSMEMETGWGNSMVVSWGSEATPLATPFFKMAYKISHSPGL